MTSLNAISESTAGFSVLPENIIQNLKSPEVRHNVLSSFEGLLLQLNQEGQLPVMPNTKEMLDYISARNRLEARFNDLHEDIHSGIERKISNFKGMVDVNLAHDTMQA